MEYELCADGELVLLKVCDILLLFQQYKFHRLLNMRY
jgi:hypothetical protein